MIGKTFAVLVCSSFVFALLTNNLAAVCEAALSGAQDAVTLSLSMLGLIGLWNGVNRVLEQVGAARILSGLFKPYFRFLYRTHDESLLNALGGYAAACFLGMGAAALPFGLKAVRHFADGCTDDAASDELILFLVLATVPFQLIPTTLLSLRSSCGSEEPAAIILPIWVTSVLTIAFAVLVCRLFARVWK